MTDDLKLVNCGCGGKAIVDQTDGYDEYQIYCPKCFMSSGTFNTEAKAVQAWNRAMGVKDINVPNKFVTDTNVGDKTTKFKQDGEFLICGKCNHIVDSGYKYCPECGSRLEWNE